jgi:hypothetical protein
MRKKIPTLLTLSTAIALLLASPMLFFNLLQPVKADILVSFRTTGPASGMLCTNDFANLTFDAHGTAPSSSFQQASITSGTFQVTSIGEGSILYSGTFNSGTFTNDTSGGTLDINAVVNQAPNPPKTCAASTQSVIVEIGTSACKSGSNAILITYPNNPGAQLGRFSGAVECSKGEGHAATQSSSSSSSMTGTTIKDSDGDGIPDSSDRCTHNSYHRCFKEGDTTTAQQEQPSSDRTGNQTR